MKLASFDIFDTTLIRLFGRPENIDVLLAGREHSQGDALEREVESRCLLANPEVRDIIRQRRNEGWQIAFISDMYLDSAFLMEILRREGCYEDGDRVYISCEHNARKDTGTLYDLVRSELQPTEWEHYGDNKKSDILMAQRKGITTHLVDNSYRELASRFVAPAYIPYVIWVLQEAKKQGIKRLYFVSRDGYILMKIAEALTLYENETLTLRNADATKTELRYFFTSRRALEECSATGCRIEYFRQEGLMDAGVKKAMVDVGWLGTSRKMINEILRENGAEPVHFFYFGTTKRIMSEEYGTYQSYLEAGLLPFYMQLLVEHYFSASPYPTTIGYKAAHADSADLADKIVPQMSQMDTDNSNTKVVHVVPVFPEGEEYKETKITRTNVEVCLQMVKAINICGNLCNLRDNILNQWAHHSLDMLANSFFAVDYSPLAELPQFDGQDFCRKLSIWEVLLIALTGEHVTIFDKGSLALTFKKVRVQSILWRCHCASGRVRGWLYQRIKL